MQLLAQQRIIANGLGQQRFDEIWPAYRNARPDAALLEGLFSPKLVELRRLIGDLVLSQRRKVVVFSQWRRMLRLAEWSLRDLLGDRGLRAVFFTGAERPSQRTQSVVDFHDDPRASVMFLSDAGGVGLNLQKAATACINLEMPWNPAVLEQRIGRIYRLGQTQPIDVFNLVSEGSIEARIAGLVRTKQALFAGLFDGTSDELRFDTAASFLTSVERIVERSVPDVSTAAMTDADATETDVEETPSQTSAEAATVDTALSDDLTSEVAGAASNLLPPSAASVHPIAELLGQVRMERTPAGSLRIEAPPEAAASLLALFDGLAKMLASSAPS
jgi:superfamily II DNA/RNA helicase